MGSARSRNDLVVSIATPYGGHDAARRGVERAPEVVPSWRDIATGSAFLKRIDATPLPGDLPFYLLFAYDNGARLGRARPSGDGTITLHSQLTLPVHLRARRSYGIDATHTSVLTDATTRSILTGLLGEHAEVTLVGGRVVHSAGAVAEVVGAPVGEDPVAVGGSVAHAQVHVR